MSVRYVHDLLAGQPSSSHADQMPSTGHDLGSTPVGILDLPSELRALILRHVVADLKLKLAPGQSTAAFGRSPLGLLLISKRLGAEAEAILWKTAKVHQTDSNDLAYFLRRKSGTKTQALHLFHLWNATGSTPMLIPRVLAMMPNLKEVHVDRLAFSMINFDCDNIRDELQNANSQLRSLLKFRENDGRQHLARNAPRCLPKNWLGNTIRACGTAAKPTDQPVHLIIHYLASIDEGALVGDPQDPESHKYTTVVFDSWTWSIRIEHQSLSYTVKQLPLDQMYVATERSDYEDIHEQREVEVLKILKIVHGTDYSPSIEEYHQITRHIYHHRDFGDFNPMHVARDIYECSDGSSVYSRIECEPVQKREFWVRALEIHDEALLVRPWKDAYAIYYNATDAQTRAWPRDRYERERKFFQLMLFNGDCHNYPGW